ncbi:hypothetical protein [Ralstonia chuxiongensis]|uniref:Uncharacterized protein n=1 Tax=Ralstonia chuxiongensis TaxID=2957504 RepID=A0AA41WWE5_9RALS|nr:hypothetical protein [Ralstonia chuxiongensis]MCP1175866.1 hypothetical protein [Ralstonia chuxiongensis]
MSFQQEIRINPRTQAEIDAERAEAALHQPTLSYAQVTAAAAKRIENLAAASVGGGVGAVYQERAVGAYLMWHDLTKGTHSSADNERLSRLAGMPEPLK